MRWWTLLLGGGAFTQPEAFPQGWRRLTFLAQLCHVCVNSVMPDITCWACLGKEGKSGTWPALKSDAPRLPARYYRVDSRWINPVYRRGRETSPCFWRGRCPLVSFEADGVSFVFHLLFLLFKHWMNGLCASLAASRPVCLFRKHLVCLLFHRCSAYLDQTFNSTTTPVSLPTEGRSPVQLQPSSLLSCHLLPLGSFNELFHLFIFFFFSPFCRSLLGFVQVFYWLGGKNKTTMRTRQGFVTAEMHF